MTLGAPSPLDAILGLFISPPPELDGDQGLQVTTQYAVGAPLAEYDMG